jgi:hypothetical protein
MDVFFFRFLFCCIIFSYLMSLGIKKVIQILKKGGDVDLIETLLKLIAQQIHLVQSALPPISVDTHVTVSVSCIDGTAETIATPMNEKTKEEESSLSTMEIENIIINNNDLVDEQIIDKEEYQQVLYSVDITEASDAISHAAINSIESTLPEETSTSTQEDVFVEWLLLVSLLEKFTLAKQFMEKSLLKELLQYLRSHPNIQTHPQRYTQLILAYSC